MVQGGHVRGDEPRPDRCQAELWRIFPLTSLDLRQSLGRVEGDLDVRSQSTTGSSPRRGPGRHVPRLRDHPARQDPQAGLVVCPICGICGGSHLYKSAYALDTAWRTTMPANATLVRNIAQACETLQSIPRYFWRCSPST